MFGTLVFTLRSPPKDAKKYGPHGELYFFLLRNMRRETDPIEPGHVSIESPIVAFPFHSAGRPSRNDPLCLGALEGLLL